MRIEHRELGVQPPAAGHGTRSRGELAGDEGAADDRPSIVVLGGGRVGQLVTRAVRARGFRCVVVDRDQRTLDEASTLGAGTLFGDAASMAILRRAGLADARLLVVAIGDALTARLAVERAREINPRLAVVARTRGRTEALVLQELGVTRLADPEIEAAIELARASLARMGVSGPEQTAITVGIRRRVLRRRGAPVRWLARSAPGRGVRRPAADRRLTTRDRPTSPPSRGTRRGARRPERATSPSPGAPRTSS